MSAEKDDKAKGNMWWRRKTSLQLSGDPPFARGMKSLLTVFGHPMNASFPKNGWAVQI